MTGIDMLGTTGGHITSFISEQIKQKFVVEILKHIETVV